MPKISIIIPVYNAEKSIKKCISSLKDQTLSDFEIIFVNDFSQDQSAAIIQEQASQDRRIILINMDHNVGPMRAREVGYHKATGEYITFCDSDDTLPQYALQHMYEKATERNADIVVGNVNYIHDDGRQEIWTSHVKGDEHVDGLKALLRGEIRHNICSKLFSRSLFADFKHESIEGLRYFEDYLLMYQLMSRAKNIVILNESVYNYIQTEGSSTQLQMSDKRLDDIVMVHQIVYDMLFPKESLRKDLYAHNQLYFSRLLAQEPNIKDRLFQRLSKYSLMHVMSNSAIWKNNSVMKAVKLIIAKEAGPFITAIRK